MMAERVGSTELLKPSEASEYLNISEEQAENIQKLKEIAENKGVVTYDDVVSILSGNEGNEDGHEIGEELLEETFAELIYAGIPYIDKAPEDEVTQKKAAVPKRTEEKDGDYLAYIDPDDAVGLFLKEVSRVPLLTAEQEVELAKRIERGNMASKAFVNNPQAVNREEYARLINDGGAAREHLITANTRLVISVAKKHMGRGVLFPDLIQDGNIGLMRAAKKFDYRRGHRFSTYATWWIRQAVTRAIANHSRTIRLPVHVHETINKISKTTRHLEQKLGRKPTTEEIAHELELPQEKVEELIKANRPPLSLETPTGPEEDAELVDFIEDESSPEPVKAADETMLQQQIRDALQTLTPREARVLELRYGLKDDQPLYLEEIGLKLGVTKERARQIEVEALSQLRHPKVRHRLADYLRE